MTGKARIPTTITITITLALALAVVLAPAAVAAAPEVVKLKLVATEPFYVDNGDPGESAGDLVGSNGALRQHGEPAGRFSSACVTTASDVGLCNVTFVLTDRGKVQGAGRYKLTRATNSVAIVGGTREFKGAGGTARVSATTNPAVQQLELRITD